jgi:DNA-binding NarL/FixJ family response regulator
MRELRRAAMATLTRPGGPDGGPGDSVSRPEARAGLIHVVLADDSPLMHLAIRSMLGNAPGYVVQGAASSVAMAEQLIQRVRPTLLIAETTIAGESGIGLCRWCRQASAATAVVILTTRDEPLLVQSAVTAGASGYLLKSSPAESIMAGLRDAVAGIRVLDDRLGQPRCHPAAAESAAELGLSRREREVLDEMMLGLGNRAIATRLCISEDTVKTHVKAVFRKLGARDRAHAVALALGSAPYGDVEPALPRLPRPRAATR